MSLGAKEAAAAEEPQVEPSEATSSGPAARETSKSYTVRDYQNPDAGALGAEQALKAKAKGKKKHPAAFCFNCGKAGAKLSSCVKCHRAYYCGDECRRKDWKRHKVSTDASPKPQAPSVHRNSPTLP